MIDNALRPILCLLCINGAAKITFMLVVLQKMAKVKASDKLSFPMKLDLAPLLGMDDASQLQGISHQDARYELMSILIHKGPSASHGHYGTNPLIPTALTRAELSFHESSNLTGQCFRLPWYCLALDVINRVMQLPMCGMKRPRSGGALMTRPLPRCQRGLLGSAAITALPLRRRQIPPHSNIPSSIRSLPCSM